MIIVDKLLLRVQSHPYPIVLNRDQISIKWPVENLKYKRASFEGISTTLPQILLYATMRNFRVVSIISVL